MNNPIFITGIGTGVGKTLISAIVTEALAADYWKPVQAGYVDGTDTMTIQSLLNNTVSIVHPELYRLQTPASPHIAARIDKIEINIDTITQTASTILDSIAPKQLVIEGAGGLLVPLTDSLMVADLVKALNAKVILVSRNYLGSINHSLLTAAYCRSNGIDVAGWIFNDDYMNYENEIVNWSDYPSIASVPKLATINKATISAEAIRIKRSLLDKLNLS
ncbi:MAG: dethiobiotin synthase [Bacteroidota bacterium]